MVGRLEDDVVQGLVELRSDLTESIALAFGLLDQRTPVVIVTVVLLVALAVLRRLQRILVLGWALLVALVDTSPCRRRSTTPPARRGDYRRLGGCGRPERGAARAVVLVGGLVSLVPAWRPRQLGSVVVAAVLVLVALSDGLLATDYVLASLASATSAPS